jgi:hypothetical protein
MDTDSLSDEIKSKFSQTYYFNGIGEGASGTRESAGVTSSAEPNLAHRAGISEAADVHDSVGAAAKNAPLASADDAAASGDSSTAHVRRKITDPTSFLIPTGPSDPSGTYTIVESELSLVGGLAGHHLIAVLDSNGTVVEELDGLATGSDGYPKPIGYLPSDTLQTYITDGGYYYSPNQAQNTLFSGSYDDVMNRLNAAITAGYEMNSENLSYPFMGLGKNSNSVASTLVDAMGLDEQPINGAFLTPGMGSELLSNSQLNTIQNQFNLLSTYHGDEVSTYNSDGQVATETYYDANGNELNECDYSYGQDGQSGSVICKAADGTVLQQGTFSVDQASGTMTSELQNESASSGDQYTEEVTTNLSTGALINATITGQGDVVTASNEAVTLLGDGSNLTVTGSGDTVTLAGNGQTLTTTMSNTTDILSGLTGDVIAGGANVKAGDNDSFSVEGGIYSMITAGNNTSLTIEGSQYGGSITVGDGSNVTVGSGNGYMAVTQSNGHLTLEDGSQGSINGNGNSIGAGDVGSVSISGNENTYSGSSGNITIMGSQNVVSSTGSGGTLYIFSGSGNTVTMGSGSTVIDEATGDTLNLTSASVTLMGSAATINGSGNSIDMGGQAATYWVDGDNNTMGGVSDGIVLNVAGSNNSVSGYQGTVNVAAGASASVSTANGIVNAAAGSSVTVDGTSNIITGTDASITLTDYSLANTVDGSGNVIAGFQLGLTIDGDGNTAATTSSEITYDGADGQNLTVTASGNRISVNNAGATVTYTGPSTGQTDISIGGAGGTHLIASNASVYFLNQNVDVYLTGDGDTVGGGYNTIHLNSPSASQSATFSTISSTIYTGKGTFTINNVSDTLHAGDGSTITLAPAGQSDTIYVNNATINVSDNDTVTIVGSNNTITGGNDDNLTITGTGNQVQATNSSIVFQGANTGDTVIGAGDGGSNWSAPDPDLPPGDNGGYTPPSGGTSNVVSLASVRNEGTAHGAGSAADASPQPGLLIHGLAAFLAQGDGASLGHGSHSSSVDEHLHLAMAS